MNHISTLTRSRWLLLTLFTLLVGVSPAWGQAKELPYSYGFEDNDLATDGWTTSGVVSGTAISSDAKKTGDKGFCFKWSTSEQYLISPELTGTENGVQISFYSKNSSSSYAEEFYIGYSTNTNATSDFAFGSKITIPSSNSTWLYFEEILPANTKYIAIKHVSDGMYQYIDDISLSVPPAFPKPTGLTLNSTTLNSATLSWTEAGSATKWDVSYSTASGDPDNPVDGGIQAAVTANPYTLEGLTAGTTYYVSVRSTDGSESGAWSDEISFTPGVLTVNEGSSSVSYAPFYGYYINNGVKSQFIIPASDLTSISQSAINKLIFYHQSASVDWGSATFKVYLKEVNRTAFTSATFEDWESMEEVYSGTLSVAGNKMEVTFATPFVYEGGNLMIGFSETTNGTSSSYSYNWIGKTASGYATAYQYNTTSNYTSSVPKVSIAYSPIANFVAKPTNVAQSAYTSTSVTLGWDNPGDVDSWEVSYRATKGDPAEGTVETANSNSKTLEDLTAETTYYVYVRAKKGEYYSAWTAPLAVTPTAAVDLTIYDKSNTSSRIPVYGPGSRRSYAQFIIPSSALTSAHNGTIKKLTFYATSATKTLNSYDVYVKETDDDTFTSTDASVVTGMTNVYSGVLYVVEGKMTVVFNTPLNYTNKNLKVAFAQQSAKDESLTWYGENQASNVAIRYNSNNNSYEQFLPKTTINYIPAALPTNPVLQVTDPESNVMGETPVNYDFGLTETAETRNFTIENAGAGTLTVKSITATGGYTLKIGDADATTSIGSTIVSSPLTLKVIQPAGTSSGTITFTTDVDGDSNDETYVINVSGVVRDNEKLYQVFNTTSRPSGWNESGSYSWTYSTDDGAKTTSTYSLGNIRLYTPKVTVAAGEKFIFEAKGTYPSNTTYQHLQLQYSADGETWTTIGSEVSLTSDWKMFTVSTPNNFEAGNYYIALNGSQVAVRKFYGGTETLEPMIALSPTTKAFNLVTNAEAQTQVFTVSNSGKADLKNLTVAVPSGFSITKEDDSEWVNTQTVAANDGSQNFKVTMSTDPGVYSGNITIDGVYGDAPGTPIEQKTITISGAVRDAECLFADFEASKAADRKPTEWTNTNWAFDNGKFAQAAYSGTSTLITQKLGISAGQKLIFMANKPYADATLGIFYCATNSVNDGDWTEVTPAAISTAATNTDIYYEVSVGDGDGLIPVGDYFIKFVGTKYIKLDDISYFKEPLVGKFEMYEYDGEAAEPYLGTEVTENQTVNLGNNVTATQTIKYVVKNAGTAAMSVTGSATGNISIAPTAPVNLAVGATQVYTITMAYDAEHLGGKSGVATISAAELGQYTVTVSGTTRDGSKAFVDFASGESVPTTWTNSGWQKYSFNSDKYVYATSEDAGVPSRMTTSRMVVAAGGENLAIKAKKSDEAGTLVVYYAATQDGFTSKNKSDISAQLTTEDYATVNVNIPEGMEYVAFDGYKVRIAEIYGLTNAPSMKVRKTAEAANLTSGMTVDFGLTASADAETFYVVNASAGSLAGIDAALTGTGFTLNKTNLTAAGGDFTIAVDPTVKGYREATVTVSGTDQENFVINLKGFVPGADGKMHETFNTESHPTGWTATGFTATAEGETLGENGSGTLRTTLMSVETNEKLAIRVKANKSSSLTDLKVKFYQKGANAPAATVDLSDVLASNTDEHTVYASIATAGNYYVEFDGSYISLLEVAGFAYNANDPTIAVYSDALANQEVATATTKDFEWVADDADAAAFTSTYYIKNNGTGTLTISDISAVEGFTAATAENATTVSGENTLALTITMNKAVIGAKSGTFTLTTDGGNFTIPVKGFVYDHSKNLVDFTANEATFPAGWTAGNWTISDGAAISASSSTIQTKKFTVAANENLYVDIKGNESAYDTKALSYSYSIDNGENWSEATNLVASTTGTVNDQVFTISDIASTTEERTVLVRITGQNLGIKHIYGFTRVDEAIMSTTAVAHDFGMQASNVDPATNAYVFTVQNDGNIDLTNLAVTLEGAEESAFAVAVAGSKTTLAAGESVDVTVTMKSSTVYGAKNDNLTIAAEGQTPVVIALSGKTRDVAKQFIDFIELDAIPAGWTAGDWTVSTPPASSDKAAYANGETTMISPAMTIAANEKLYFDARVLTAGSLTVSYTTNGGATWHEMNNLVALNSMTAQELSFGNDAEVTAFVKFTGKSAYIDNICGGVATTAPLMDIATAEVADGNGNYDFGQDLMAAPAAKVFTITNIGSDNLVATIAATGDVTAEFETTGTKNGNEVTLANGQTATITVSMAYEAENAGAKTGAVTITSAAGVATLNFIGKTIDNRTLSVDFADGLQPEGWYFGTNWSVNAYSQFASNDANSTPSDLITQQLIVDGTEDELTFKAAKTNNSYTFKVYTSQDRVEWNEVDLSALTLTESYKTVTVSGLAAGNYYLKISGAFVKVDDFLGWKKVTGIERDLYVTATTFPATTTKGNEATITATVTSLIAEEKGVYAKLFIDDAEEATATAQDIALNGTKTFSFSYAIPENKTAQIKVYYSDNAVAFVTAENAMKVNYVMSETSSEAITDGTFNVTLDRTFVAGWNTICLPFAVADNTAIETLFGAGAKVFNFKNFANSMIEFEAVTSMTAATPYLIYVPAVITEPIRVNNVTITGLNTTAGTASHNSITFHGSYAPVAAGGLNGKYGVTTANKLAKGNANTTMKGFRAYFEGTLAGARIYTFDDATGISHVYQAAEVFGDDDRVYNMNGQHVENAKKGVYIVNGRKVVIK